ncbi:MAG: class I adenylate-forming enzyme family protein [Planctomycetota bacterium]
MTLVEQLENNAREFPEKSALVFRTKKMNYRQLNDTVNRLASSLLEMNLSKGDRVGLMLPRIPELVVSFLGVAKAGAVVVPINFELTSEHIRIILETVSASCLIVHALFLDLAKASIPAGLQIPIIVVGQADADSLLWDEVLSKGEPDNLSLGVKEDDVFYLNYTSGSTGCPKGTLTTHSNVYWNTLASINALGLGPDDVHLCMFAPFAHPHEIVARPLYLGGTMVLVDKIYPKSLAEAISVHKVTTVMGLAPMYDNLLAVLEHKAYDLSSLRIPESGGMYTHPGLINRFRQKVGVPIIPVWGSTETTGVALANHPGGRILPGSVGNPCASYRVKIVDENGQEVRPGEVGEMIFKGPAVVQGYHKNTGNDQACFRNGWYHSSDLARKDEEGHFYFVERKTGMMKVAGLKVYPLEIELALTEHPEIEEAAVISAKDRLKGEVPQAIIVTRDGNKLTERQVRDFCRGRLDRYKIPRIVEIRQSLPKMSNGKIDRKMLV